MRKLGVVLFLVWAAVFVCGAVGELFEIEWLRRATDLKRLFLR